MVDLESYLKNEKKIVFYVGERGTGKKYAVNAILNNYNTINLNFVQTKGDTYITKKNFFIKLEQIVLFKSIHSLITLNEDVIVIHGMETIHDKALYSELRVFVNTHSIRCHIIVIFNTNDISERLMSFIEKEHPVIYHKKLDNAVLVEILKSEMKQLDMNVDKKEMQRIITMANGNIIAMRTYLKQLYYTGEYSYFSEHNVDKSIVIKCFDSLCNSDDWIKKIDIIKQHGSLIRLLIPYHISQGLDVMNHLTWKQKSDIVIKSLDAIIEGELNSGIYQTDFLHFIQCIYPTFFVKTITIKSMVLFRCQQSNVSSHQVFMPFNRNEYLLLLYFLHSMIVNEKQSIEAISNLLPNTTKASLQTLQQKHLNLFDKFKLDAKVTKKMINKFVQKSNAK